MSLFGVQRSSSSPTSGGGGGVSGEEASSLKSLGAALRCRGRGGSIKRHSKKQLGVVSGHGVRLEKLFGVGGLLPTFDIATCGLLELQTDVRRNLLRKRCRGADKTGNGDKCGTLRIGQRAALKGRRDVTALVLSP